MSPRALLRREPEFRLKKRPQQRRAQATFDTIVEAGARLMIERGFAGITTNHIAAAAGIAIASLYEYFPGKDAIVAVVAERLIERVISRLSAAIPDILAAPPEAATLRWIEHIHHVLESERKLVAVFVGEVPYTRRLPAVRQIQSRLLELSRDLRRGAGPRVTLEHETASLHLIINLVSSTILQLVLDPPPDIEVSEVIRVLALRIERWASGG